MGPRVRGPDQGRAQANRQDPVGLQRARDASASGQGRRRAQGADEGGQSAGWRDEKNREPVRIRLDEHNKKSAGKKVPRFRRRQTGARQAGGKENLEEVADGDPLLGVSAEQAPDPRRQRAKPRRKRRPEQYHYRYQRGGG